MPHFEVKPRTRTNARNMRKALTEAELKLWNELRAHRLMGLSFRRQMPVDRYIVDFACPAHKLIIELDGSGHTEDPQARYDLIRSDYLNSRGWTILRFWNDDVLHGLDDVCSHILTTLKQKGVELQ